MKIRLLAVALALPLSACATLPKTGAQPTGEPLVVDSKVQYYQWTAQEKVGDVTHKDESGRVIGTSEVYENRTHTGSEVVWKGLQGPTPLDDEDFFRIAGDTASAQEIHDFRDTGVLMNRVGWGTVGAGVAAMVGGYAAFRANDGNPGGGSIVMTSGLLLACLGGTVAVMGSGRLNPDVHPLPLERAERAAVAYNAKLQAPPEAAAQNAQLAPVESVAAPVKLVPAAAPAKSMKQARARR